MQEGDTDTSRTNTNKTREVLGNHPDEEKPTDLKKGNVYEKTPLETGILVFTVVNKVLSNIIHIISFRVIGNKGYKP